MAEDAGCEVRRAAPGPLERHFPHGVIRTLLEAPLRGASAGERARLLEGAAGYAGRLLLGACAPGNEATTMVAHSVFWLCSALAAERPLVLVVDDAQWSDRASLEVLCYLARRIEELPLVIVVGARAGDPDAPADLLSLLGGVRAATVLRPRRLSVWGAVALIRRHAPGVPVSVGRESHREVGGSPWLLDELGRQIAAHGAADPSRVTPVARDVVRRRLAALPPRARAVAAAMAVLGPDAPGDVVAALARIAIAELSRVRDALWAAGLLAPDRMRLAHELIATAVADDLVCTDYERMHREAASLLAKSGAGSSVVAGHLMECAPHGDPEVTRLLAAAAADAVQAGTPLAAAGHLERALRERAADDDRGGMLARLGAVEFDAGLPGFQRHLREALDELSDPAARVDVLGRMAALGVLAGGDEDLVDLLDDESDPGARIAALDALAMLPDRRRERARRLAALDGVHDPAVVAHRAWAAIELGSARAEACAALALEALQDGALLRDATRRAGYHLAVRVVVMTDRHAEARRAIDALREAAAERGSVPLRAAAAWYAGELALRTGDVRGAEREARAALELTELDPIASGALEVLVGRARSARPRRS